MTSVPSSKKCFTSVQSRKFLGSCKCCELCPSMDLVLFGDVQANTQSLYRTLNWQKVATVTPEDEQTMTDGSNNSGGTVPSCVCWSPDGRWMAVARDRRLWLYGVESLANNNSTTAATGGTTMTESQHSWLVDHKVLALSWSHLGSPHPTAWKLDESEKENETSWRYQSFFMDKAIDVLPPSGYHQGQDLTEDGGHPGDQSGSENTVPKCKTPLSVLVVATTHHLEFYLHGRYRLIQLPHEVGVTRPTSAPKIVASHDLTCFVVLSQAKISLYRMPFLDEDRYPLQAVAALHSSIHRHIRHIRTSVTETLNLWKSTLKPLDTKLAALVTLLTKYSADNEPLSEILKQFVLVGHTSDSSEVANAMDQFFTSIQMNDQLILRMERTLHGSLANVESHTRKNLLNPSKALALDIQEVAGLVRYHGNDSSVQAVQELVAQARSLWLGAEALVSAVTVSRFRLRDFCSWLRSAGSQMKARGTATNSVQRENAMKRRVPQAVLERFLDTLGKATSGKFMLSRGAGLTESLLCLNVANFLLVDPATVTLDSSQRPSSPVSVSDNTLCPSVIPTIACTANSIFEAATVAFKNPLSNIPDDIVPVVFDLPAPLQTNAERVVAIHTRLGRDPRAVDDWSDDDSDDGEQGYFAPKIADGSDDSGAEACSRTWSLFAHAEKNVIILHAVALPKFSDSGSVDGELLVTKLSLGVDSIDALHFYSDDGKSSLSSGTDSGSGREGRQKLGILVHTSQGKELWLTPYDNLSWQRTSFAKGLSSGKNVPSSLSTEIQPLISASGSEDDDEISTTPGVQIAETRVLTPFEGLGSRLDLRLSGSRGIAAVVGVENGVTTMSLLDLEESETSDGEEEDESDE